VNLRTSRLIIEKKREYAPRQFGTIGAV